MAKSSTPPPTEAPVEQPAPTPDPFAEVAAKLQAELDSRIVKLRGEFEAKLAVFRGELVALQAKVAELPVSADVERIRDELRETRQSFGRLAKALDRPDFVYPPATAEQVRAALLAGQRLRVLRDYRSIGVFFQAGRTIESNQVQHPQVIDAVARGQLQVSILRPGED